MSDRERNLDHSMDRSKGSLTRRQFLKGAGLALSGLLIWPRVKVVGVEEEEYPATELLVDPTWLEERLGQVGRLRAVDFREESDYWEGHIEGAVNLWKTDITRETDGIPNMVAPQEIIEGVLGSAGIGNEHTVVAYGAAGNIWSSRLFWTLEYYGHQDVKLLNGGIKYWRALQKELTRTPPDVPLAEFNAQPKPELLATAEWLLENLDNPEVQILDARSPEEYTGEKVLPNTDRGGHIPGAVLVEWKEAIDWEDETFKPYPQLEEIYTKAGLSREKTIVTYCQTGIRAAHSYFTLRLLGYPKVRLYDGSWIEWANREELPIEAG